MFLLNKLVIQSRYLCLLLCSLIILPLMQKTIHAQAFIPPTEHAVYVDPINGSNIHAEGTPTSPYATIEKGTRAAWQKIQKNVRAGEEMLQYFDASVKWAVGLDSLPATTGTAVMVVDQGDLFNSYPDTLIYLRLEQLGFHTTLITDNRVPQGHFTAAMAEEYDLLVITESAGSSTETLSDVKIPVINMRSGSWRDWHMSTSYGYSETKGTKINIIDGTSPLAAETTGTVTVYYDDWMFGNIGMSALPAGANPVASVEGSPSKICLFSIDKGEALSVGTAPARRVGFFLFARPRTELVFMEEDLELYPEIIVAEGYFPVDEDLKIKYRMRLRGGWDASFQEQDPDKYSTVMDGQNKTHMIELQSARSDKCQVEGITFINGYRDTLLRGGAAIYCDPDGHEMHDIIISKCKFYDNHSDFQGGAIYVEDWNGEIFITDCTFSRNTAPKGDAIAASRMNNLFIDRCLFTENSSTTGGQAVIYFDPYYHSWGWSSYITNNVFSNNETSSTSSHIIELNSSYSNYQRVYNNTFYNNRATGEIIFDANDGLSVIGIMNNLFANNICTGEQSKPIFQHIYTNSIIDGFSNNLVYGNTNYEVYNPVGNAPLIKVGVNAIEGDPYFNNPDAGDFRLFEWSAAVDTGAALTLEVLTDFAGNSRPQGFGYDIGAFEYDGTLRNSSTHWQVYQ